MRKSGKIIVLIQTNLKSMQKLCIHWQQFSGQKTPQEEEQTGVWRSVGNILEMVDLMH